MSFSGDTEDPNYSNIKGSLDIKGSNVQKKKRFIPSRRLIFHIDSTGAANNFHYISCKNEKNTVFMERAVKEMVKVGTKELEIFFIS